MATCVIDGRPTDLRLCPGCVDALKSELRAIPDLVAQLDITLTRQARIGERNGPRSTETPLPYHAGASVDLETITTTLLMWVRTIAEKRGVTLDARPDPVELSKWLLRHPTDAAQLEDARELFGNIHAMTKAARRTIDLAPDKRFLGPCDSCGEDLYVFATPGRLPETVHCANEACDFSAPVTERRAWLLERAFNQILSPADMSRAIGELIHGKHLTPNLISRWASRGLRGRKLTPFLPHPKDPYERTRFSVEEVITFVRLAMGAEDDQKSA